MKGTGISKAPHETWQALAGALQTTHRLQAGLKTKLAFAVRAVLCRAVRHRVGRCSCQRCFRGQADGAVSTASSSLQAAT